MLIGLHGMTLLASLTKRLDIDDYLLETNLGDINDDDNKDNEGEQKNKKRSKAEVNYLKCLLQQRSGF